MPTVTDWPGILSSETAGLATSYERNPLKPTVQDVYYLNSTCALLPCQYREFMSGTERAPVLAFGGKNDCRTFRKLGIDLLWLTGRSSDLHKSAELLMGESFDCRFSLSSPELQWVLSGITDCPPRLAERTDIR